MPAKNRNSSSAHSASRSPVSTFQTSAKFVPARIMNGMMTHWTAAENASMERASGENPPVGIVVNGWANALNSVMFGAVPARWSP